MTVIDHNRRTGAALSAWTAPSSGALRRTTSFCTGTAVRTSKAPPSFTKLGTLMALFALFTVVLWAVEFTGGAQ